MGRAQHIVALIEGFKLGSLGISKKPKAITYEPEDQETAGTHTADDEASRKEDLNLQLNDELSKGVGPHFDSVLTLLKLGADPDTFSDSGWPVLLYAANKGLNDIILQILKYKASINIQDKDKWTALMWAVVMGHFNTVSVLLRNHANPNIQNNIGETALMMASEGGHEDLVAALLLNKADATIKNHKGETAFQLAKDAKMRKVFRAHGVKS